MILIGLLVFATLRVDASPYSPYTAVKEDQKNVILSDEAVAAYFKKRFETEELKPAMVMEYLVKLMGKKSKPDDEKKDVICVNTADTTNALQKSQLEMILDTVYPVTGNHMPFTTLVTPNRGLNMYITETDPLIAYQVMFNAIEHHGIPETDNIWTNYSPCSDCATALLRHYNKPEDNKPTIHVARVYTKSSSFSDAVKTLQCLAKLVHVGFSVVPWNFIDFKDHSSFIHESCKTEINAYLGSEKFNEEYMELVGHLEFVNELSQNPHVNTWCE